MRWRNQCYIVRECNAEAEQGLQFQCLAVVVSDSLACLPSCSIRRLLHVAQLSLLMLILLSSLSSCPPASAPETKISRSTLVSTIDSRSPVIPSSPTLTFSFSPRPLAQPHTSPLRLFDSEGEEVSVRTARQS